MTGGGEQVAQPYERAVAAKKWLAPEAGERQNVRVAGIDIAFERLCHDEGIIPGEGV
jgi:hypothetical protein